MWPELKLEHSSHKNRCHPDLVNGKVGASPSIKTSNGVIHVIDTVLIPETAKSDSLTLTCEKILIGAVDVGVDLFNNGDRGACEKIYKMAVLSKTYFCCSLSAQ